MSDHNRNPLFRRDTSTVYDGSRYYYFSDEYTWRSLLDKDRIMRIKEPFSFYGIRDSLHAIDWLDDLRDYFDYHRLSEHKRVRYAVWKLRGDAKLKWDSWERRIIRSEVSPIEYWDEMINWCLREFMPPRKTRPKKSEKPVAPEPPIVPTFVEDIHILPIHVEETPILPIPVEETPILPIPVDETLIETPQHPLEHLLFRDIPHALDIVPGSALHSCSHSFSHVEHESSHELGLILCESARVTPATSSHFLSFTPARHTFDFYFDMRNDSVIISDFYASIANIHRKLQDCGAGVEMILQITPEESGRLHMRAMGVYTLRRQMGSNTYGLGIPEDMGTIPVFYVEDLVPHIVLEEFQAMHSALPVAPVVGYLSVVASVQQMLMPMPMSLVLPPAATPFQQRRDLPELDFSEMEPGADQRDDDMLRLHSDLTPLIGQRESGMLQMAVFHYLTRWKGHPG